MFYRVSMIPEHWLCPEICSIQLYNSICVCTSADQVIGIKGFIHGNHTAMLRFSWLTWVCLKAVLKFPEPGKLVVNNAGWHNADHAGGLLLR